MKKQQFTRLARRAAAACVCLSALAATAPARFIPNLFSWQVRQNMNGQYESTQFPQPVCAKVGAGFNIYIFTNYQSYPGETGAGVNNYQNIRVGRITTGSDTYQLLPDKLPGLLWREFAAAAVNPAAGNGTVYLFGGRRGAQGAETDDVYAFDPAANTFSAFPHKIKTDTASQVWGQRAGAVAIPLAGKIYLFGGYQGSSVLKQVQVFDPGNAASPFTVLPASSNMPVGLVGARGMAKAAPNGEFYIYLVGGSLTATPNGFTPNTRVYRFHAGSGQWATVKSGGSDLTIPAGTGAPTTTWDRSGNVRIIAAGGAGPKQTWANMQAWILNDSYGSNPTVSNASLTAAPYNSPARARDNASAVKCGDATYLIGGTYGQAGTTFQNRGLFVDRLVRLF